MNCFVCLRPVQAGDYHPACARRLFGSKRVPAIDVDQARLTTFALAMVGRTTLSGAQEKLSLGYDSDRTRLLVETDRAVFILKPQQARFAAVPENEHVTMLMARLVGIPTPVCGLTRLADGALAYLVKRFDREHGAKQRVEDFCQLAEKMSSEKYDGSAELCMSLTQRYASEPLVDLFALFRRLVFSFWTGNGDMHLKNFSLLAALDGRQALSPAYDLVCTRLVIPDDQQALTIGGKRARLKRRDFEALASYAGLPSRAAESVLANHQRAEAGAVALIEQSYLDDDRKRAYREILTENTRLLNA